MKLPTQKASATPLCLVLICSYLLTAHAGSIAFSFRPHCLGAQNGEGDSLRQIPRHLEAARALVNDLQGVDKNVYGGGRRRIDWEPGHCSARTVCSSFITLLFQHTYQWDDEAVRSWLHSADPEADAYYDAVADHHGFRRIRRVDDLRPGDLLAIKYTDHHVSSNGVVNTGHVMLVDAAPRLLSGKEPFVTGTRQYAVTIIDSSASGHGPADTRHRPDGGFTGGIGRGIMRLYTDEDGVMIGYTWSESRKSQYYTGPARELAAGRLLLDTGHGRS
jgi:hypothetical protein